MTADRRNARERILEQSFLLFLAHGFEATSMSEIVRATGMSKGAVYHHFASKDELFTAAIDRYFVDLMGSGVPVEHEVHGFDEAVRAAAATMTDSLAEVSSLGADLAAYYRFLFYAIERHRPEVQVVLAARVNVLSQAAKRDSRQGARPNGVAPDVLAKLAITTIEGAALLAAVEGPERLTDLVNEAVDGFLALVRADELPAANEQTRSTRTTRPSAGQAR